MLVESDSKLSRADFTRQLHRALLDLYDLPALSRSPLIFQFRGSSGEKNGDWLRRFLMDAIEKLKPPPEASQQSSSWRVYRILLHRYIQQIPQREIAASLGFSVRQLQRLEQIALQNLSDTLWHQRVDTESPPTGEGQSLTNHDLEPVLEEMQKMQFTYPLESIHIEDILRSSLRTSNSLLEPAQISVSVLNIDHLPPVEVKLIPLRQAIVLLLSTLANHIPQGQIEIRASQEGDFICMSLFASTKNAGEFSIYPIDPDNLNVADQLVTLSGGRTTHHFVSTGSVSIKIDLPVVPQIPILVIDDNPDTLQLIQRSLAGSRYQFIGSTSPDQALQIARDCSPRCIILDVMLPSIDGWEVLSLLREHPSTQAIPIIVSSILPHHHLALSIGAAAFLKKPVSQQVLLETLDSLCPPERKMGR